MSEAQLQKLKVTELKELLSKHELPQTGKKDDLVKRLMENNIAPEGGDDELVEPETNEATTETAPEASSSAAPATTEASAPTSSETPSTEQTLTPEQQAMKARAERFGIPFNPNAAASSARTKPAPTPSTAKAAESTATAAPAPAKKEKAGAIDKAPLGISEDVLAKRAAKFGLPEKKEAAPAKEAPAPAAKPASTPAPKPEIELTPEQKEKMAADEEKKRKRAEKFGTAKPANGVESEGSDAKKAKV